jgi:hypothetical protein
VGDTAWAVGYKGGFKKHRPLVLQACGI